MIESVSRYMKVNFCIFTWFFVSKVVIFTSFSSQLSGNYKFLNPRRFFFFWLRVADSWRWTDHLFIFMSHPKSFKNTFGIIKITLWKSTIILRMKGESIIFRRSLNPVGTIGIYYPGKFFESKSKRRHLLEIKAFYKF